MCVPSLTKKQFFYLCVGVGFISVQYLVFNNYYIYKNHFNNSIFFIALLTTSISLISGAAFYFFALTPSLLDIKIQAKQLVNYNELKGLVLLVCIAIWLYAGILVAFFYKAKIYDTYFKFNLHGVQKILYLFLLSASDAFFIILLFSLCAILLSKFFDTEKALLVAYIISFIIFCLIHITEYIDRPFQVLFYLPIAISSCYLYLKYKSVFNLFAILLLFNYFFMIASVLVR